VPQALVDWWTRFQDVGEEERGEMLKPDEAPKKKRRPRGRGRKRTAALADAAKNGASTDEPPTD
jgi:poly(A) polymerase